MIKAVNAICIGMLLSFVSAGQSQQPVQADFTGTWTINLKKSEFKEVPAFVVDTILVVRQTADSLLIERSGADEQGKSYTVRENASLTGSPTLTITPSNSTKTLTVKWNADNTSLTKDAVYSFPGNPAQLRRGILQTWSLSPDKNELVMESTFQDASNKYSVKAVYEKQNGMTSAAGGPVKMQIEKIAGLITAKKYKDALHEYDVLEKMDSTGAGIKMTPRDYAVYFRPRVYEKIGDKKNLYMAEEKRFQLMKRHDNFFDMNNATWYMVQPDGGLAKELRDYNFAVKWANYYTKNGTSKNPGDLDTLAWAYFGGGNAKKAVELEMRALNLLDPNDPDRKGYERSIKTFKAQ